MSLCLVNPGTRGRRCNKANRERNTPRRQQLPLELQSSSISRGRQIKLLTQYPLYPYNKNKYDLPGPSQGELQFLHRSPAPVLSREIDETTNARSSILPFLLNLCKRIFPCSRAEEVECERSQSGGIIAVSKPGVKRFDVKRRLKCRTSS